MAAIESEHRNLDFQVNVSRRRNDQHLDIEGAMFLKLARRLSSFHFGKFRTLEWMKISDCSLRENFERSEFVVFVDQKPLLRMPPSYTTKRSCFLRLTYEQLQQIGRKAGVTLSVDDTALLDIVPGGIKEQWVPVLAMNIRPKEDGQKTAADIADDFGGTLVDFREALIYQEDSKAANLLSKARTLLRWCRMFRFCPRCAAPLKMKTSKASALCLQCQSVYYPPVWPAAIVLVMDSKRENALLIRHPWHPAGLYTAIAGFNECGEPMEETAVREVSEEVGVEIHKVEYIGMSQPWPFPQNSLMFAFFGQVANDNARLNVENSGLKAKWFSKDEVKKAFKNSARPIYATNGNEELRLPPPGVIAHDMIHKWLVS